MVIFVCCLQVVIKKLDEPGRRLSRTCSSVYKIKVPDLPFLPTVKDTMRFNSITIMKVRVNSIIYHHRVVRNNYWQRYLF